MSGESKAGVAIRPVTAADTAAIMAVWAANGDEIPEGGVDILTPYLSHLISTGRVVVATDANHVVGFGAVVERAGVSQLADLFVLPDRFGQGIGGRLLAAVFGDAADRTTFASSDPGLCPCTCVAACPRCGPTCTSMSTRRHCPLRPRSSANPAEPSG